jgi:hypothetical protein
MHGPETKVEKEVEILRNKPSQQPKSMKSTHRIKWRVSCCETAHLLNGDAMVSIR